MSALSLKSCLAAALSFSIFTNRTLSLIYTRDLRWLCDSLTQYFLMNWSNSIIWLRTCGLLVLFGTNRLKFTFVFHIYVWVLKELLGIFQLLLLLLKQCQHVPFMVPHVSAALLWVLTWNETRIRITYVASQILLIRLNSIWSHTWCQASTFLNSHPLLALLGIFVFRREAHRLLLHTHNTMLAPCGRIYSWCCIVWDTRVVKIVVIATKNTRPNRISIHLAFNVGWLGQLLLVFVLSETAANEHSLVREHTGAEALLVHLRVQIWPICIVVLLLA